MLQINLLPQKFTSQIRNSRIRKALVEVSIVSILILLLLTGGILLLNGIIRPMVKESQQSIVNEEQKIKKFANLEKEIKTYQENSNLYQEVLKQHYNWSDILAKITQLTPADLQISQLSIEQGAETTAQKKISFSGKAKTRRDVAKFVKKLEDSDTFESVELTSSSLDQEGKADFQITAILTKN